MRIGVNNVISLCNLPKPITSFARLLKISFGTTFFLSSVYGSITILYRLPISDKSIILIPVIILTFLFGGASIGIYQSSS